VAAGIGEGGQGRDVKRNWRRFGTAIAVLVGTGLAAGALFYFSTAPTLVAAALGALLDRRVEIEDLDLRLERTLRVDIVGVRIFPGHDPNALPQFEAERLVGRQRWPRVFAGVLIPLNWELERPILRLGGGEPGGGGFELPDLPAVAVSLEDGRVEIATASGDVVLTDLRVASERRPLTGLTGNASGHATWNGEPAGRFDLGFSGEPDDMTVDGLLEDFELSLLPQEGMSLAGVAHGRIRLRMGDSIESKLDIEVSDFEFGHPSLDESLRPAEARLTGAIDWEDGLLSILPEPLAFDDFELSGEIQIPLARGDQEASGKRVRGALRVADFAPGVRADRRLHLLSLMGLRFESWKKVNGRIEAGPASSRSTPVSRTRSIARARAQIRCWTCRVVSRSAATRSRSTGCACATRARTCPHST